MDKDPKTGKTPSVSKLTAKGKLRGRPRKNGDFLDMPRQKKPSGLETLDIIRARVSVWSPQLENEIVSVTEDDPRLLKDPTLTVGDVPEREASSMRKRLARHRKELGLERKKDI